MAEYRAGCILKYFDKEYVDDFVDRGVIHFSQLGYFIDLEGGDDAIADSYEGSQVLNLDMTEPGYSLLIDGKKVSFNNSEESKPQVQVKVTPEWVKEKGIVSMANLDFVNDFKLDAYNEETNRGEFVIKPDVIRDLEKLSNNKSRVPIIIDAKWLMKRLDEVMPHNYHAQLRSIKYYDEKAPQNITFQELQETPENVIFLKRDRYKYQREVRITLLDAVPEEGENIALGSMVGHAFKLDPKTGLETFKVAMAKSK